MPALRGLVWHEPASGEHYATAAGIVLLARDPSAVFPQCRILADAYRATEPDGDPRDHEDIRAPMPLAVGAPSPSSIATPGHGLLPDHLPRSGREHRPPARAGGPAGGDPGG